MPCVVVRLPKVGEMYFPLKRTFKSQRTTGLLAPCRQVKGKRHAIHVPKRYLVSKNECDGIYYNATFIKEFVVKLPEGEHLDFNRGLFSDVPACDVDFKSFDIAPHLQIQPVKISSKRLTSLTSDLKMKILSPSLELTPWPTTQLRGILSC